MKNERRPLTRIRKAPDGLWQVETTDRWSMGAGGFLGMSPSWGKAIKKANDQAVWWTETFGELEKKGRLEA